MTRSAVTAKPSWLPSLALMLACSTPGCGSGGSATDSDASVDGDVEPMGPWGIAQLIETDDTGNASAPQIAIDAAGNAIAVWQQYKGAGGTNIWANRYELGSGWGTAALIELDDVGDNRAEEPQVAVDPTGSATVVWSQFDGMRTNIWANRYEPGSGWGTATLLETDNTSDVRPPQVAVDPFGNVTAVWIQSDNTFSNVWSNRYVPGSGWGTATLLETEEGGASQARVAVDGSGNAIAVWRLHNGIRLSLWANRYVSGVGWGTAALAETSNEEDTHDPDLAVDSDGNINMIWLMTEGIRFDLWANRYVVDSGWGTATLVATSPGGISGRPQIAVDPAGNATAVWAQSDGPFVNIWANTTR